MHPIGLYAPNWLYATVYRHIALCTYIYDNFTVIIYVNIQLELDIPPVHVHPGMETPEWLLMCTHTYTAHCAHSTVYKYSHT